MTRNRAAFTLIELLVVVSIIAILMALIFTGARGMIKKGNQVKSLNNLRQIATGFMLYAGDNDNRLPTRPPDGDGAPRWPFLINEYLKDKKVFAAPDDPRNYLKTHADPLSNSENNTSYIMNGGWDSGPEPDRPLALASIEKPSQTILLSVVFDDANFFLDVNNDDDQGLIRPDLFGSNNDYVFMDGSARVIEAKDYRDLDKDSYLWLIKKTTTP